MLKRHSDFFKSVLFLSDMVLIALTWAFSYVIRFYAGLVPVTKGIPPPAPYLALLPVILVTWGMAFRAFQLYRPRRISSRFSEMWDVTKACSFSTMLVVAIGSFLRPIEYSRAVFVLFWLLSILLMTASRWSFRELLRFARRRGHNLRYALVIGAGSLGQDLAAKLHHHRELGIQVVGFLSRQPRKVGQVVSGIPVLGVYNDLQHIMSTQTVDQVFLALPKDSYADAEKLLWFLQDQMTDVRIVPDLLQFMTVRGNAELFDGMPIVTLQATPLYGWSLLLKRALDVAFSLIALSLTAPLTLTLALLVKVTSPGTVFHRQKRMGYDGHIFEMIKFRTMREDAERETGAVWTQPDDPRRTSLGVVLRSLSLDELPQFWNVLKGEMSIVGPRPERPEFVEIFRRTIPKYMLRHKIKAGMTGWAQIRGWRGNTSLDERIKCDLEYLEKWSFGLDLKIIWLTLWRGLMHRNAY